MGFTDLQITCIHCWPYNLPGLFLFTLQYFHVAGLDWTEVSFLCPPFNLTHPSVVGFLRRMLGRGEEPCAGALALWLWVCTTVVAAEAVLKVLLIGLATMVAPSARTTAGKDGCWQSRENRRRRSSYWRRFDNKAGVCRTHAAPLLLWLAQYSAVALSDYFITNTLTTSTLLSRPAAGQMVTAPGLTTAGYRNTFTRRRGRHKNC